MLIREYQNLTTDEKLTLVEEIWESIGQDAKVRLSEERKIVLDERLEMLGDPNIKRKTKEEVREGIKRKKK